MDTLPHRLGDLARRTAAAPAVRAFEGGAWRHLSFGELEEAVGRRVAGLPEGIRGRPVGLGATSGVDRVVEAFALLHVGGFVSPGAPPAGGSAGRETPGLLVRLRAELREGDRAVGDLDHRSLRAAAELVPADALHTHTAVLAGWAAVASGRGVTLGPASLLPVVGPVAWVAPAAELEALALPPSRAGALGRLLRPYGRADAVLGARLRRVAVLGPVPPAGAALRARGVLVDPLPEAVCASSI